MGIGDSMSVHVQLDVELAKLVAEAAVATTGPIMAEDLHGLEVSMGVGPLKWTVLKISRAAISSCAQAEWEALQVRRFSCYRFSSFLRCLRVEEEVAWWRKVQRLIKGKARWSKFSK
jgi:hypothetical protein